MEDIKSLINKSINTQNYNDSDFVAIQFMEGDVSKLYILKNRHGQQGVVYSINNIVEEIKASKKLIILNINELEKETKEVLMKNIQQMYMDALDIR